LKHSRELFWHYWLPVLLMLLLIRLESTDLLSGEHTAGHLARLLAWLGIHLRYGQLQLLNLVVRKGGHIAGYGLLGFCWFLLIRGTYWLQHEYSLMLNGSVQILRIWWRAEWAAIALLLTFLVAASDELHQMEIPSRTGSWHDVLLDCSAAAGVLLLVRLKALWVCRNRSAAWVA
jgi:VanZ family protein